MLKVSNTEDLDKLKKGMQKKLDELESEFGIRFTVGKAKFLEGNATIPIDCDEVAADGTVVTKSGAAFKRHAMSMGFSPDDLGKEFEWSGVLYKIVGLNTRSTRKPIRGADPKGGILNFGVKTVKDNLVKSGLAEEDPDEEDEEDEYGRFDPDEIEPPEETKLEEDSKSDFDFTKDSEGSGMGSW